MCSEHITDCCLSSEFADSCPGYLKHKCLLRDGTPLAADLSLFVYPWCCRGRVAGTPLSSSESRPIGNQHLNSN